MNLDNLEGAKTETIKSEGFIGYKVAVNNPSLWGSKLEQLIPLFGKVIFEEYEKEVFDQEDPKQQPRALHQIEVSFKDIDYMYILENEQDFVGLIAMKVLQKEPKIGVVIELILEPKYRGKGISKKLYDLVFKQRDFYVITSYSRYPAAVSARHKIGQQYGYETVFGDMAAENADIGKMQSYAKDYFLSEGIVSPVEAPPGYMFLKGELNINEPLKEGDAKFDQSDPLFAPFNRILEIQKTNEKDTAVGLLVSIRKDEGLK
jgi:GNAT superfamily N-acetyltransferase